MKQARPRARRPGPNFCHAVNKLQAQEALISEKLEPGSSMNLIVFKCKKLRLEAGLREILAGSASSGLDSQSSSSARAQTIGLVPPLGRRVSGLKVSSHHPAILSFVLRRMLRCLTTSLCFRGSILIETGRSFRLILTPGVGSQTVVVVVVARMNFHLVGMMMDLSKD